MTTENSSRRARFKRLTGEIRDARVAIARNREMLEIAEVRRLESKRKSS